MEVVLEMSMNINWSTRFIAASIHFLITLLIAGIAAALIFFVWFPGEFAKMVGGKKLFLLVVCSDLVLGPLISLVIFNTKKSRKELIADYLVVGLVQLTALIYGVSAIVDARPVFIAFAVDRLEVATAIELDNVDLAEATDSRYRRRSWMGPKLVGVQLPTDAHELSNTLSSALAGKDVYLMPKYYRPYDSMLDQIKNKSLPLSLLREKNKNIAEQITIAMQKNRLSENEVRWLPVHSHFGFWTALIDVNTGYPIKYLPIDPL